MLEVKHFTLGPVQTNAYLLADTENNLAAVVDPAADGHILVAAAQQMKCRITQVWLTHAHFDHIAAVADIAKQVQPQPLLALHSGDLALYHMQGGAHFFGMQIDPGPEPDIDLAQENTLQLGDYTFQVRHTPGHTPGHVVFYNPENAVVFSGDLIFMRSVGRTDLPGGSHAKLITSIRDHILNLPDETRLLSGHGPATTVGQERNWNPFLS